MAGTKVIALARFLVRRSSIALKSNYFFTIFTYILFYCIENIKLETYIFYFSLLILNLRNSLWRDLLTRNIKIFLN